MLTTKWSRVAGYLTIVSLLAASCAPAAPPPQTPEAPVPIPTTVGTPGPAATPKATDEEPKYGGTLTVYTPRLDPKDLDLISDHTMPGLTKIRAAYSGLLQYDPLNHGKIIPDLAERWEATPDGKSYTFFLRKGVKWHDGQPFSSADVKYTLQRTVDPNDPEKIRLMTKREAMSGITSVETPDADTVRVNLQLPRGSFIPWTAWGPMVMGPKHIPIGGLANTAVGTGAFKFKAYLRSSTLDLVKNPDYFIKGRPYLDGLTFYIIKDITTTMAAFRTRRILLARDFLPSKAREVKETMPQAELQVADGLAFGFFGINASKPPFTDQRVRRAASMAIDREAGIQVVAEGYASIGTFMPPGEWARPTEEIVKLPGYRKPKDVDIAEAKKLMAEAGFANGFKTSLLTASLAEYERPAVFLKDQLSRLGIDAALDMKEYSTYNNERTVGNFSLTAAGPGAAYIPDPAGHRKYYGRENFVGMKDNKIFDLIDQQDATTDRAQRQKLLRELDDRLLEQAAIVPLYWTKMVTAVWPEVKSFKEWSVMNNHAYTNVWLAK
ncbi:MAG: hypothetical protein HYX92_14215 [Chloroflexi bacterium]|nr:hypothetical protein [Chloroflexota bacterium]